MTLIEGIEHLNFLSEDLDRLAGFYERVVEAEKTLDLTEEGHRHIFLQVGSTTVLHPFQILDGPALPPAPGTMFERGRLDHFALLAPSEEAFREIRRRLESEGAAARPVRDTGDGVDHGLLRPRWSLRRGDLAQARRAGCGDASTRGLDDGASDLIVTARSHGSG